MKLHLLAIAIAALCACGKKNDAHILEHEAVTLGQYYAPKLDALQARVDAIFKRGSSIPGNLPGIEDVGRRLQEARDTIVQLRGIVAVGPDQKSAVQKQAEAAAKDGKVNDLQKLVNDTETMLERGVTIVNDDLDAVESWIANYDRKTLSIAQAAPAAPAGGEPQPGQSPPTPEGVNTPQTGQPPPAAGSAAPKQ